MAVNLSRLASANTYDNGLANLSQRQNALSNLQEKLTSGKKVVRASDDPTGAAQAERALTRLSRIATDQRALEAQRNTIANAESTLGDVVDALQQFRELVVSAGNGSHTAAERKTIAGQLQGLREQILGYANRTDTNGQPLFGALASAAVPFSGPTAGTPDYAYNGLPGQTATSETAIASALDGESAFMSQPSRDGVFNVSLSVIPVGRSLQTSGVSISNSALVKGSAYTLQITAVDTTTTPGTTSVTYSVTENPSVSGPIPAQTGSFPTGQLTPMTITGIPGLTLSLTGTPAVNDVITIDPNPSIFSVMDDAIRDIGGATNANAATQAVGQALYNLDVGMNRVSAIRGQAGDLLNRADRITSNQESKSIQLEADRSRAEDLDMIKGVADFQNQTTAYQAALQSYAQVQKLSLFNYLG
ncbi:flagellar hook-associated protein FlgL [Rhodoferax bucti]|uniref:flagellar hook-associated protein FlgL n=1 Tax=Rhodoferax bucti TaxID=2576305 RepID=UPI00110852FC|nr:flagellar hook-associated protein FlgL [Rhodoferax bucti]